MKKLVLKNAGEWEFLQRYIRSRSWDEKLDTPIEDTENFLVSLKEKLDSKEWNNFTSALRMYRARSKPTKLQGSTTNIAVSPHVFDMLANHKLAMENERGSRCTYDQVIEALLQKALDQS